MTIMPVLPKRKSLRLQNYNYSHPNAYFITICVKDRKNLLWKMDKLQQPFQSIPLSQVGKVVDQAIREIPAHYANIQVDQYIIMPNHVHMILVLSDEENLENGPNQSNSATISRVILQVKSAITKNIGYPIWQKSFYDHIIRDDEDYAAIMDYIEINPQRWADDRGFGS